MSEIIDEGETGFVVDSIEEAVLALARCAELDRDHVRQVFERRFSADRMVSNYEAIYRDLIGPEKIDRNRSKPRSLSDA
jgi:glycosyltransferase involved in cell wall biosynthesis